jgi:hypothetical protein
MTLMRTVETVDREDPRHVPCETRTRASGWDPIRGLHQGQRPQRPHSKAEYMAAPDLLAEMSAGAVHTWHIATFRGDAAIGRSRG